MRRKNLLCSVIISLLFLLLCPALISPALSRAGAEDLQSSATHDREFWRSIVQRNYTVPAGESAFALARELSGLLGSPDHELRDSLAYVILATWIEQGKFSQPELLSLLDEWRANLRSGLGESGTDSVLKRSFSALCLASLADYDLKTPFLGASRYRALLADAQAYIREERDIRGYDENKGWIHATAHTADLLKYLAGNTLFTKNDQQSVLAAIAEKLSSVNEVYTQREQDRLAQVVVAIVKRADFDGASFNVWLERLMEEDRAVWSKMPPKLAAVAKFQNRTYMFEALLARMSMENLSPAAAGARDTLIGVFKTR
jgi:Protein of unknown function (DUF2785)